MIRYFVKITIVFFSDGEERPWSLMRDLKSDPSKPTYVDSPFGLFGIKMCKKLGVEIPGDLRAALKYVQYDSEDSDENDNETEDILQSQGKLNPHYCPSFLAYLMKFIFPFACMFDHSLIYKVNGSIKQDTNTCSESWNSVSPD
jgi:hypothetical protein